MAGIFTVVAGIMIAIVAATQLRQGKRAGWYAILVALLIGSGLYALGLILQGIASLKAGVFSHWVAWLWIVSVVVGIPGFAVQSLMELFFAAGGVALGAAYVLAGYGLWAQRMAVDHTTTSS